MQCPCCLSPGELFPGSAKATRAYLHKEDDVEAALAKVRRALSAPPRRRGLSERSASPALLSHSMRCALLLLCVQVGWKVKRREMTSTSFYFSKLLEFERA